MQKAALERLLNKNKKNPNAHLFQSILDKHYGLCSPDQDIPFVEIISLLEKQGTPLKNLPIHPKKEDDFGLYLALFKGPQLDEKKKQSLEDCPNVLFDHIVDFLYVSDQTQVSLCSTAFYKKIMTETNWKKNIGHLTQNSIEFKKVLDAKVVQNYKKLYRILDIFTDPERLEAWQIYWLSGEEAARQYAITFEKSTADFKGRAGLNLLHHAILSGSLAGVEQALELKVPVSSKTNSDISPLHIAARRGNLEIMKLLIEKGVDAKAVDHQGCNSIHHAAKSGSLAAIKLAVHHGPSIHTKDSLGSNLLHLAAEANLPEIMEYALDQGIDPNDKDLKGWNVLFYAVSNNAFKTLNHCLKLNLSIHSLDYQQRNLLQIAAWAGHVDMMRYLASLGASTTHKDINGRNLLHWACAAHPAMQVRAMKCALELGALIECDNDGNTLLHYVVDRGHGEGVTFVRKLFKEKNINISSATRNRVGITPEELDTTQEASEALHRPFPDGPSTPPIEKDLKHNYSQFFAPHPPENKDRPVHLPSVPAKPDDKSKKTCLMM